MTGWRSCDAWRCCAVSAAASCAGWPTPTFTFARPRSRSTWRCCAWAAGWYGAPKSRAGERVVALDADSVTAGKAHRALRRRERLAAGTSWQASGQAFTCEDGSPLHPDHVSRRFRQLAQAAGLPVIRFHAARHTAASLALEADIDLKIVSDQLGHSTTRITQDLYQHVRHKLRVDAAEKVVALLPTHPAAQETGS
jgi:integrase